MATNTTHEKQSNSQVRARRNPTDTMPGLDFSLTLLTFDAHISADRIIEKSDRNLSTIEKIIDNVATKEDVLESHNVINEFIKSLGISIDEELVKIQKLREDADMLGLKAQYKEPFVKEFVFHNPKSFQIAKTIRAYDTLMQEADVAWLGDIITSDQRKTLKQLISGKINQLANKIATLATRCRTLNNEKRREDQSRRDKQRNVTKVGADKPVKLDQTTNVTAQAQPEETKKEKAKKVKAEPPAVKPKRATSKKQAEEPIAKNDSVSKTEAEVA